MKRKAYVIGLEDPKSAVLPYGHYRLMTEFRDGAEPKKMRFVVDKVLFDKTNIGDYFLFDVDIPTFTGPYTE